MIIQFSFSNYKAFKERVVLNMIASNYDKDTHELDNVIQVEKRDLRIVKSSVIYGANAGGKSKFIDAITFFKSFIVNSSKDSQGGEPIQVEPFKLSTETREKPSDFEMIFMIKNTIYRYGFEVDRNEIIAEWLYARPAKKEVELYYRTLQSFEPNEKRLPKAIPLIQQGMIRKNSLLLSVLAQFNDETANEILAYFGRMNCFSGLNEYGYKNSSIDKVHGGGEKHRQIVEFLRGADLGIEDLRYEDLTKYLDEDSKKMVAELREHSPLGSDPHMLANIRTKHRIFDENNQAQGFEEFVMSREESHGTQKYFHLSGLILDALEEGMILFVDELDAKLHPNLVCKIVSLFNSKARNPRNAQLIFNTHDTNLLSSGIFRRDQIWFIEKNRYGAAKLYSLANFKNEVRKNEAFEDNYIRGKYGATPFLNEFDQITEQILRDNG